MKISSYKIYIIICLILLTCNPAYPQNDHDKTLDPKSEKPWIAESSPFIEPVIKRPWTAAGEVVLLNVLVNRFNAWVRHPIKGDADFAFVSWDSWKANIEHGLEWDWNSFQINFIGHPYQGSTYYNAARSLGMDFWEATPYAFAGSLTWEYFGETHPPSGNDLVTTTLGGIFLGEVLHRLSDQVLDDSTTGSERKWREFAAFAINPVGGFNRWVFGESKKHRSHRNHAREPIAGMISLGGHLGLNSSDNVKSAPAVNLGLTYGDPFQARKSFKPFDYFNLRTWIRFSRSDDEKSVFLNVYGYGLIWGKHLSYSEKPKHLAGVFQHFDYIHNEAIEIGAASFSGGLMSDYQINNQLSLTTSTQLGPIVLGGSNSEFVDPTEFSDDPGDVRDYILGPGLSAKIDLILTHKKLGQLIMRYGHWTIVGVSVGPEGTEHLNILNTKVIFNIWKNWGLGVEHSYYHRNAKYDDERFFDIKKDLNEIKLVISLSL